ncbi:DUF5691 domain-containing protein [Massilia niastensis]|uniref:DUF5691 domain-containing protein n=1 Tax=Massilia niastensis TaxID=544911 RepID=UPI00035C51E1|nr:DUF5691 domain-containing protein [Massilia niastensis]
MSDAAKQMHSLLQVGTSRAVGARIDALPPELAAVLATPHATTQDSVEEHLWLAIGSHTLWARAGYIPEGSTAYAAAMPVAATEQLRPCPGAAEALLARLLQGEHAQVLLHQWLQLLQRYGGRLPPRFLPNVLALAGRQAQLQSAVSSVLGERGRWLARLEPEWQWALARQEHDNLEALWQTGTPAERKSALRAWRAIEPAAALAALAASWSSEPPERRAELLACLDIGLGPDDEAFLEAALDDRRKEVRIAAQPLLARLPGSGYAQRMQARAEPLLQVKRPLLGRRRLEVELPAACDKTMARDGIGIAAHRGLGEKAGWVVDIVAAVDPRSWSQRFQMPPAECLALAAGSEFAHAVIRGWAMATVRGVAPARALTEWIDALASFWLANDAPTRHHYPADFFDVFQDIEDEDPHAFLTRIVSAAPHGWGPHHAGLLELLMRLTSRSGATWPAALSRHIVERLLKELPATPDAHWLLRQTLTSLAPVVATEAVLGLEAPWLASDPPAGTVREHIATFFDTVRFRHEMSLSFQEPA